MAGFPICASCESVPVFGESVFCEACLMRDTVAPLDFKKCLCCGKMRPSYYVFTCNWCGNPACDKCINPVHGIYDCREDY